MTQGFDEWFKKRHTKSGWYEKTLLNDDDALYLKHEMSKAHNAGAASRQAEINALSALGEMSEQKIDDLVLRNVELKAELEILQGMHNAVSLTAWDFVVERDELQKRINDALDYVFGLYCTGDLDTERLENILKGEK